MINKKHNRIGCLNCQHSYRNESGLLKCFKGNMTSVTHSDKCKSYQVFVANKEELQSALSRAINSVKDYD